MILSILFGQTLKTLTVQESWNDLYFGMEGVLSGSNILHHDFTSIYQ
jgi:hypothetical protein